VLTDQCAPQRSVASPMSLPAIPGIQEIGETVVGEARDLDHAGQADEASEPGVARRAPPDFDGAIRADMELAFGIERMQAPPHVLDIGAEAGEGIWLEVDVAKLDRAGSRRLQQAIPLPVDAGITDRAFGVVPDGELGTFGHAVVPSSGYRGDG